MTNVSEITLGEARRRTIDIRTACETGQKIMELVQGDNIDDLKIAEYALLTGPITRGLSSYLDNSEVEKTYPRFMLPGELCDFIGWGVAEEVKNEFNRDPHHDIVDRLAKSRADLLPYPQMVYPVGKTLESAAIFSANALYIVAVSNALVIDKAGGRVNRSRQEFIAAIKRSKQLALARPIMHLEWNNAINDEIVEHGFGILDGRPSANDIALQYDGIKDKVILTKPLEDWTVEQVMLDPRTKTDLVDSSNSEADRMNIDDIRAVDTRIGCPVSFDPALVKRYYERVVDLIETHQAWPDPIADERKKNAMILAKVGIIPGFRV